MLVCLLDDFETSECRYFLLLACAIDETDFGRATKNGKKLLDGLVSFLRLIEVLFILETNRLRLPSLVFRMSLHTYATNLLLVACLKKHRFKVRHVYDCRHLQFLN